MVSRGCPHGVMVKVMDGGIVVSGFVLQSYDWIHFRTNTLGKGMNPLILPSMPKPFSWKNSSGTK